MYVYRWFDVSLIYLSALKKLIISIMTIIIIIILSNKSFINLLRTITAIL